MYDLIIEKKAQRFLQKQDRKSQVRLIRAIDGLATDPRPAGVKKMKNRPGWRVRVGTYRIIYHIEDERLVICVVDIGHRKEVYR